MVALRRSYEKVRTPERTVRRGRDPNVPVTLYQELDGLTERVDALTTLIGGTRDVLLGITSPSATGKPSPTGSEQKPSVVQQQQIYVPLSGTAGASHLSEFVTIPVRFEIRSISFYVETVTTASIFAEYRDEAGSVISLLKNDITVEFSSNGYPFTVPSHSINGNDWTTGQVLKKYDPGSVRLRISGASPNSRVYGVYHINAYNEV